MAIFLFILLTSTCGSDIAEVNSGRATKDTSLAYETISAERKATAETLAPLVQEHAFQEIPTLDPQTQFRIKEYEIPNLWHVLKIQLFVIHYIASDGNQFNERTLIYHEGEVRPFVFSFGGHGLMSAVLMGDYLYYTYSFGSGMHRSHIGRLSIDGKDIQIFETRGYIGVDLFVRAAEHEIQVESGYFHDFNSWHPAEAIGRVQVNASTLVIVNSLGVEVSPQFPR